MIKFKGVADLQRAFPTDQDCIQHLERIIWKGVVVSPFDANSKVYKCKNGKYKCKNTGKYFTVKTGTVFDNTKLPLWKWFWALSLFSSHKRGIASHQLARDLVITQKSAWFILQRLRGAFDCSAFKTMLKDFVEIDETYVGGSNTNRHKDKKVPRCQGRSWKDKTPVLVMIERKGNVIAQVVPNVKRNTLEPIIRKNVKENSNVYTDEWKAYRNLGKWYKHKIVNHGIKQYVNEDASTNSAENFNSHLKRMINGIYYLVSKKHLRRYVNEITLRFNTRNYSEKERFDLILSSTIGKKMTYRELISS